MEEIVDTYKNCYSEYIESLHINHLIKEHLLDEQIFSGDYEFYLFYPRLFSEAFDLPDNEPLKRLSIAGFLYFLSLINLDGGYDAEDKKLGLGNMALVN
ncbi:MAG TPA: hypothetical protein DD671_14450, partial [Balneolaceae bacterium]|nr:hypothetical protein [Balneolaceae bacterium]